MKRKFISLAISMLILATCVLAPIATVSAASSSEVVFEESWDFNDLEAKSSWTAEDLSQATGLGITIPDGFTASTADGVITFATETQDLAVIAKHTLATPIEKGKLTIEYAIKPTLATGAWHTGLIPTTDGSENIASTYNGSSFQHTDPTWIEGGWFKLRAEYTRLTTQEDWQMTLYDIANSSSPRILKQTTIGENLLREIANFNFLQCYSTGAMTASFDDFKVKYESINTNTSGLDISADFAGVEGTDLSAEYLTDETGIDFTSSNGITIEGYDNASFYMTAEAQRVTATYNFPAYVMDGELSASLSFTQLDNNGVWHMFAVNDADNHAFKKQGYSFDSSNYLFLDDPAARDDVYNFRVVYRRLNKADNWTLKLYDENSGKILVDTTLPASDYPYINKLTFFTCYSLGGAFDATFDNLKVKYNSVEDLKKVGCDVDFSGITGTGITAEELSEATGLDITADNGISTSANNNVSFEMTEEGKRTTATYKILTPVKTGKITASLSFAPGVVTGAWHMLSLLNEDEESFATNYGGASFQNLEWDKQPQMRDGMYRLRAEWIRFDEASNWTLTLYDDSDAANPVVLLTRENSAELFDEVTGIKFFTCYSTGTLEGTFDDLKVTYDSLDLRLKKEYTFNTVADFTATSTAPTKETIADITSGIAAEIKAAGTAGVSNGKFFVSYDEEAAQETKAYVSLPSSLYKGVATAEFKISKLADDSVSTLSMLGFANKNGQSVYATDKDTVYSSAALNAGTNMYHLRAVIYRDSLTSDWTLDLYDDAGYGPNKLSTSQVAAADLACIDIINLFDAEGTKIDFTMDDVSYTTSSYYADVINLDVNFADVANGTYHEKENAGKFYDQTALGQFIGEWNQYSPVSVENGQITILGIGNGSYCRGIIREVFPVEIETGKVSVSMEAQAFYGRRIQLMYFGDVAGRETDVPLNQIGYWELFGAWMSAPGTKNGNYYLRTEMSRETTEDSWTMNVYDDSGEEPRLLGTRTYDMGNLAYVNIVDVAPQFENDIDGAGTFKGTRFSVSYTNGTEPSEALKLLTDEKGNIEFGEIKFEANGRRVTALSAGTTELTAKVSAVNNADSGEKFALVVAVYNKDGRLINVAISSELVPSASEKDYSVTVTGFETEAGAYAKAFVMSTINTLNPLGAEAGLPAGF